MRREGLEALGSIRSKRFRGVSEQRKTAEPDLRYFGPVKNNGGRRGIEKLIYATSFENNKYQSCQSV